MINSHKEFIDEMRNFASKMELIKDFIYIKDIDLISQEITNSQPRVLAIGLDGINFDDKEYNSTISYKFVLSDSVLYDENAILNSETENIFIISALKDYLNYVQDAETELIDVNFITETDDESSYTTVSGSFDILIKRSPSYWKQMETYSV